MRNIINLISSPGKLAPHESLHVRMIVQLLLYIHGRITEEFHKDKMTNIFFPQAV